MHDVSIVPALIGGMLLGLSGSLLLFTTGKVAGISGVFGGLLRPARGDVSWRAAFLFGMLLAGAAAAFASPELIGASPRSTLGLLFAGLLVGVGTRLGNGCTSGHGICGVSRLSARSIAATITFVGTGVITVALARQIGALP